MRETYPRLAVELWEDVTRPLLELLRAQRLDAALVATEQVGADLATVDLFQEPSLALLPKTRALAKRKQVREADLAADLLVLADGHCLATQSLTACGAGKRDLGSFQAASLETLVTMVESGYGTTLVPARAANTFTGRNVILRPLAGRVPVVKMKTPVSHCCDELPGITQKRPTIIS